MNTLSKFAVIGVGMALAASASADTLTFNGPVIDGVTVSVIGPNNTATAVAGEARLTFGTTPITAFCIELEQNGVPVAEYSAAAFQGNAQTIQRLNTLYENFLTVSRTSGAGTSAFQLAVWEIIYDTGASPLSTATGSFRVRPDTDPTAASLVNSWLNTVNSATAGPQLWSFTALSNPTAQDLLTATRCTTGSTGGTGGGTDCNGGTNTGGTGGGSAVDAAGTLAMLGIGFGALGWVQRRTRARR